MLYNHLMKFRSTTLFAVFALLGSCGGVTESEPATAPFEARIVKAAFADGRAWIIRADGNLYSFAEGDESVSAHAFGEPVLDMCDDGSKLWVVTVGARYTLRLRQGAQWLSIGQIDTGDDFLLGLGCGPGGPVLVTNRTLVSFDNAQRRQTMLSTRILPPESTPIDPEAGAVMEVVHLMDEWVFVGLDMGEWGGGLRRIDRRSGVVETIERTDGELCSGPLNTGCDRVQAIAQIPWQSGCLALALDIGHGGSGRVTRVCGREVEQFLAVRERISSMRPDLKDKWRHGGFGSTPFLGAAISGQDLILASGIGLFRMNAEGVTYLGWPATRTIGDVSVSFAIPGTVLLAQNWNSEYSYYDTVRLIPRPR